MHAQLSSKVSGLNFGLYFHQHPQYASRKGSGKLGGCLGSSESSLHTNAVSTKILAGGWPLDKSM